MKRSALLILVCMVGVLLTGCNGSKGTMNITTQVSTQKLQNETSHQIKTTGNYLETLRGFMAGISKQNFVKASTYLDPSYRNKFKNQFLKSVTPLDIKLDAIHERSSDNQQIIVDCMMSLRYAYSTGDSTLKAPVSIVLHHDVTGNWVIDNIEANQKKGSNTTDYMRIAQFYELFKTDKVSISDLKMSPQYEVRLEENKDSVVFDQTKSNSLWLPKLQSWIKRHPFTEYSTMYVEKTTKGFHVSVVPFEDGDILYLGFDDQTGKIDTIYSTPTVLDME